VNESPLFINIFFIKRSLFFNLLFTHHNSLPLERRKYLIGLAKERYLIKKLARFTMQAKDVKIRANFSDVRLDAFKFTKIEENAFPTLREEGDIDDSCVVDIKYLVDSIETLSGAYRRNGIEVFIANSLKLSHKNLVEIFTKAVVYEGLSEFSAKKMISNNKYEFYKNKELFALHLAVRYILDGNVPRSVKEIVQLVYPEIKF